MSLETFEDAPSSNRYFYSGVVAGAALDKAVVVLPKSSGSAYHCADYCHKSFHLNGSFLVENYYFGEGSYCYSLRSPPYNCVSCPGYCYFDCCFFYCYLLYSLSPGNKLRLERIQLNLGRIQKLNFGTYAVLVSTCVVFLSQTTFFDKKNSYK